MPRTHRLEARARSSAPVERVWAVLTDTEGWNHWSPMDAVRIERLAPDGTDGLGAFHRLRRGRTENVEEIVAFEPPRHYGYAIREGNMPARDYRGDVRLVRAAGGGTEVTWSACYRRKFPGTGALLRRPLERFTQDMAERLCARAER